jgi:nitrogen fixation protein FixH
MAPVSNVTNPKNAARTSPWPWAIAGGLGVVVAVNIFVVRIAASDPPVVEADRPYEVGEAYQTELEAFRKSAALGYTADVSVGGGRVTLKLTDRAGQPVAGLHGALRLERPDRKDRDQTLNLTESAPGTYEATGDLSPAGVWRVHSALSDARGQWLDDRRMWVQP